MSKELSQEPCGLILVIRRLTFITIIYLSATNGASPDHSVSSVFIDSKRPGVCLSFEKIGSQKSEPIGETTEGVFLKFHNNTRWTLHLEAQGEFKENGDAGLFYEVLEDPSGYPPTLFQSGTRGAIFALSSP